MLQVKTIVVKEATDKGKTIQIVDADKLKFTLWKTHSKGGPNPSFEKYQQMGGVGASLTISYEEKDDSFTNNKGEVVNYKKRTIYEISPKGTQISAPALKNPPTGQILANNGIPSGKSEVFWEMKAYKQCLWAYWKDSTVHGKTLPEKWKDEVWNIFGEINKDAETRFPSSGGNAVPTNQESLNTLVEGIPF